MENNRNLKLICIFSKESIDAMGGNRGKMAAQAGHAYLHAVWNAETLTPQTAKQYKTSGNARKICLIVETTEELATLYYKYVNKVGATFVQDAGKTVFKEPTLTCVGIGPISDEECGEDLNSLKVFI